MLDRLDRLVQGLDMAQLATTLYARLQPPSDGSPPMLRYANAGHLYPVLHQPDGPVRFLDAARSLLIGVPGAHRRADARVAVPPGSTVLLYTDGLVERRNGGLEEGLQRLAEAVRALPATATPDALCDAVLTNVAPASRTDDIAMLAVQIGPRG